MPSWRPVGNGGDADGTGGWHLFGIRSFIMVIRHRGVFFPIHFQFVVNGRPARDCYTKYVQTIPNTFTIFYNIYHDMVIG